MKALVLAAGKSTRIAAASAGLPKPLLPIAGRPVVARTLEWLSGAGIRDVWINLHYRADDIRSALGDGSAFGVRIQYALEPEILGTAGAYRALASHFDETTLVVYGDNLMSFDVASFVAAHRRTLASATIAVFDPERHMNSKIAGGRVMIDDAFHVTSFEESASNTGYVNTGAYLLEPRFAAAVGPGFQDFGRDVFPRQLASGGVCGYLIDPAGYCLGLDTPESLRIAEQLISTKQLVLA
jgi:NDP-sugar pyrophosphorylase family protein